MAEVEEAELSADECDRREHGQVESEHRVVLKSASTGWWSPGTVVAACDRRMFQKGGEGVGHRMPPALSIIHSGSAKYSALPCGVHLCALSEE
jgi:hypothetical protein